MRMHRTQGRRWSKLQRRLDEVLAPEADLQIHCAVYPMHSVYGRTGLPRYWITVGDEIIWDYPRQFQDNLLPGRRPPHHYPYGTDVGEISNLIEEYLDTPRDELFDKRFEDDHWGLVNILRAADRRFGARRLPALRRKLGSAAARKVLDQRAATTKGESWHRERRRALEA